MNQYLFAELKTEYSLKSHRQLYPGVLIHVVALTWSFHGLTLGLSSLSWNCAWNDHVRATTWINTPGYSCRCDFKEWAEFVKAKFFKESVRNLSAVTYTSIWLWATLFIRMSEPPHESILRDIVVGVTSKNILSLVQQRETLKPQCESAKWAEFVKAKFFKESVRNLSAVTYTSIWLWALKLCMKRSCQSHHMNQYSGI
jgi:hypothetical protein